MAVYKSIYCYPFSENADISCVLPYFTYDPDTQSVVEGGGEPFYFSCRVDSSNKNVIGYSIKIYDDTGKVVFPLGGAEPKVSLVAQLPHFDDDPTINSGVNGTYLKIPFFQLYSKLFSVDGYPGSYNALYCRGGTEEGYTDYSVVGADLIIGGTVPAENTEEARILTDWSNFDQWIFRADGASLIATPNPEYGVWDGIVNGITVTKKTSILVYANPQWRLFRLNDSGDGLVSITSDRTYLENCYVRCGEYSGFYFVEYNNPYAQRANSPWFSCYYDNAYDEDSKFLIMDGSSYSWEITLYQGPVIYSVPGLFILEETESPHSKLAQVYRIDPSKIPGDWYDMTLGTGNILGSDGKRLQLSDLWETRLPGDGLESPIILTNKYIELGKRQRGPYPYYGWVYTSSGDSLNVVSFDSSLGHVYLSDYAKNPVSFLSSQSTTTYDPTYDTCCFYKYSTNENEIYNRDMVKTSFDYNIDLTQTMASLVDGDRVLLMGQTSPTENGVYVYSSRVPYYTRAADFSTWGEYIGRVIFVRDSKQNYSNSASAGGTIDLTPLYFFNQKPIELFPKSSFDSHDIKTIIQEGDNISEESTFPMGLSTDVEDGYYIYGEFQTYGESAHYYHVGFRLVKVESGIFTSVETEFDRDVAAGIAFYRFSPDLSSALATRFISGGKQDFYFSTGIYNYGGRGSTSETDLVNRIFYNAYPFLGNCYAKILYNDTNRTFVQPNNYLAADMKVKLLGGGRTKLQDADTVVSALNVLEANHKFWYFTHERLSSEDNFKWILYPCGPNGNSTYRYSLISCCTVGNENPFTDYSAPYLYLDGERTSTNEISVPSLFFMADAHYTQGQGASWESYRFTLKDGNGNIIQDTGEKYNKDTRVLLLGLDADSSYTLDFTTVDDIGYRTTLKNVLVTPAARALKDYTYGSSGTLIFNVSFECFTHSVLIEYIGNPDFEFGHISVYRREIGNFRRTACNGDSEDTTWYGEWHPVVLDEEITDIIVGESVTKGVRIRDFNISNDRTYQYAVFPKDRARNKFLSSTVFVHWDEWSIVELIPEDPRILVGEDLVEGGDLIEIPIVKRKYKASPLDMWLLKMDMDAGSQEQNITRSESQTLGQYDRVGYAKRNFDSGSISCYLGSEIVPLSKTGYAERLRGTYAERYSKPRTSNQSAQMLETWRKFAQSPNPKLLTDRRGRKWIIQITSSNVTPQEPYIGVPAKISFSWKEIEDDYAVTISGSGEELASPGSKPEWRPIIF